MCDGELDRERKLAERHCYRVITDGFGKELERTEIKSMKSMLRHVTDGELRYDALAFVCPGCLEWGGSGLHLLPVNTTEKSPAWEWNESLDSPTLSPSILTGKNSSRKCHSFLTEGVFTFLNDSTHSLAGQRVPMPDLPEWFTDEVS